MKQGSSIAEKYFFGIQLILLFSMCGCTVVKVVDAAASTAIGVTVGVVKATGKVLGAAIPDGDKDDEDDEKITNKNFMVVLFPPTEISTLSDV